MYKFNMAGIIRSLKTELNEGVINQFQNPSPPPDISKSPREITEKKIKVDVELNTLKKENNS